MEIEVLGRALTTLPADDDHPYRTGAWRPQTVERSADELLFHRGETRAGPLHAGVETAAPVATINAETASHFIWRRRLAGAQLTGACPSGHDRAPEAARWQPPTGPVRCS